MVGSPGAGDIPLSGVVESSGALRGEKLRKTPYLEGIFPNSDFAEYNPRMIRVMVPKG